MTDPNNIDKTMSENEIMIPPTYLSKKNAHPRDFHITFDEGPHIYTIDGDSDFMSVTTWNHAHFGEFDPDLIIDKMMKSQKWPCSPYYGMTKEEIKAKWSKEGKDASTAGTKLHYDIECFYNKMKIKNDSVEYGYFKDFLKDYGHLKPYRTEWMVYDKKLKLAGSIDMVFENDDGTLQIYDWKRCKKIKKENKWQSSHTPCLSHLPDVNFAHYSLQLNTYKYMLEKRYGKKITDMCLVCLHPNNENGTYIRIPVLDLSKEVAELMKMRREMVKREKEIYDNIEEDVEKLLKKVEAIEKKL